MAAYRFTAARRAALRQAALKSARKRQKSRAAYKAKVKAYKQHPRVKAHTRAVVAGIAAGAVVGLPSAGGGIASARDIHKNGPLPTHPRVRRNAAKKGVRTRKRNARKRARTTTGNKVSIRPR